MDTLTVDVRGIPDERIRQLERIIEQWKKEEQPIIKPMAIKKRKVHPSEFPSYKTKLTGPLTRELAYEQGQQD